MIMKATGIAGLIVDIVGCTCPAQPVAFMIIRSLAFRALNLDPTHGFATVFKAIFSSSTLLSLVAHS
jgi:hypothetical protein